MHTKVTRAQQVSALERVLEALAEELIESTDEELLQAAQELGMDPTMRGSAAFIGLRYPSTRQLSDFFELAHHPALPASEAHSQATLPAPRRRVGARRKGPRTPRRKPDA
jgi:hypothetical protein